MTLASGVTSKAVSIQYPRLEFDVEVKKAADYTVEFPNFTVYISLEVQGTFMAQKKGTMYGSFNLRTYEASITKDLGPLGGGL